MLFNSLDFALFLPIVFYVYWLIGGKKLVYRNLILSSASIIFYAWWDWRFLILIFISALNQAQHRAFYNKFKEDLKNKGNLYDYDFKNSITTNYDLYRDLYHVDEFTYQAITNEIFSENISIGKYYPKNN